MKYLFVEYPKCSTCQKAKKYLEEKEINYEDRHIVENTPTVEELQEWINRSNVPIKKLFNTSGLVYKEMNLKEKLQTLTQEEQLVLLAGNGMLIKRPLLVGEDNLLIGFKIEEWENVLKKR